MGILLIVLSRSHFNFFEVPLIQTSLSLGSDWDSLATTFGINATQSDGYNLK